jgi:ABC-type Zn uptake system ZnuABC Zn-binding protein ZnuA
MLTGFLIWCFVLLVVACGPGNDQTPAGNSDNGLLTLPELTAVEVDDGRLKVVATTGIIGDVVAQVGGDQVELTTLMAPGQDPHSYEPAARDLTTLADADVVFVNGWDLEEGLVEDLANIGEDVPIVPISANIVPLSFGGHEDDHSEEAGHEQEETDINGSSADPHVWFNIQHVEQWVENVVVVLSALDPAGTETYQSNAAIFQADLEALADYSMAQLVQIPEEERLLVTNHDSFSYFAQEYGFDILGTVFAGGSTVAEPAAGELADLIETMAEHGVCTIFTETTVSDKLAQTIAAELRGCDQVQVLFVYTGALGPAGSGADSYLGMMRANVDTIVKGLK